MEKGKPSMTPPPATLLALFIPEHQSSSPFPSVRGTEPFCQSAVCKPSSGMPGGEKQAPVMPLNYYIHFSTMEARPYYNPSSFLFFKLNVLGDIGPVFFFFNPKPSRELFNT